MKRAGGFFRRRKFDEIQDGRANSYSSTAGSGDNVDRVVKNGQQKSGLTQFMKPASLFRGVKNAGAANSLEVNHSITSGPKAPTNSGGGGYGSF